MACERRQTFGNNPDTSKALRFLLAESRTLRTGLGGRKDPYSYVVRPPERRLRL